MSASTVGITSLVGGAWATLFSSTLSVSFSCRGFSCGMEWRSLGTESESLECGMELLCSGGPLSGVESELLSGGMVSELRGHGMESGSGVGSVSSAD
jgi:hypothetical protein